MRKWLSFALFCNTFVFAYTPPDLGDYLPEDLNVYPAYVLADQNFSPIAGGIDLKTTQDGFMTFLRQMWPDKYNARDPVSFLSRAAKYGIVVIPLSGYAVEVQEQLFGRGYRIRSLGKSHATVKNYQIPAPYPYWNGQSATNYTITKRFSISDQLSVDIASTEATAIYAGQIRQSWINRSFVDPSESALYLLNQFALRRYVTHPSSTNANNNINNYSFWLSILYPTRASIATTPSQMQAILQQKGNFSLLDPFSYFAAISLAKYLINGEFQPLYMFPIGSVKYLPSIRPGLTPFGPEVYFDNYINYTAKNKLIYAYYRQGQHKPWTTYRGFGASIPNAWTNSNLSLGVRVDFWSQPNYSNTSYLLVENVVETMGSSQSDFMNIPIAKLIKKTNSIGIDRPTNPGIGALGSITVNYSIDPKRISCITLELGFKSSGYVQGFDLNSSPIARLGLQITY